ncbi:MAG TPA: MFS transporter [Gemmataceae bacterium]|nr:MFS transporter [Gemmataceae bacterium]
MIEERLAAANARRALPRLTASEWLVLVVLAALQFTHNLDYMIMMPLLPQFEREMGISPQQFGFLVSAYAFSAGISGLLAAVVIDRFDRKRALLLLYAGFTVGTLLCALAPGYLCLLLARTVAGAFGGVVAATSLAIIGDLFSDSRRGRAMGVMMSAFSVALIVGVPAGLYLANRFGWRSTFGVLGVVSALVLLLVLRVLPPLRGHLAHVREETGKLWAALSSPTHVRAYVLMIALVFSTLMIVPYLADYLVANGGRSEHELPWVYLAGGLSTLCLLPLVGRISDRFPKLAVFRIIAVSAILPVLVVTHLPQVSLGVALFWSTLFMVITASRMVPAMALITASASPRHRGSFMTINSSVQQLAAALAALVGGSLLDKAEGGALTGFQNVGYLASLAMVLSAVLAGRLRPAGSEALKAVDVPARSPLPSLPAAEELFSTAPPAEVAAAAETGSA